MSDLRKFYPAKAQAKQKDRQQITRNRILMKKTLFTIAILLGLTLTSFADGSLFQRSYNAERGKSGYVYFGSKPNSFANEGTPTPMLPSHGMEDDQSAPIGSGVIVLMGLGAAYLVAKKRKD